MRNPVPVKILIIYFEIASKVFFFFKKKNTIKNAFCLE